MEPFDIEKAKTGTPVITRAGLPARIICFDKVGKKPIVALIGKDNGLVEEVFYFSKDGVELAGHPSRYDLFHPTPEMWVNVYDNRYYQIGTIGGMLYPSKQEAERCINKSKAGAYKGSYKLVKE